MSPADLMLGTVKSRLGYGLKRLREMVEKPWTRDDRIVRLVIIALAIVEAMVIAIFIATQLHLHPK